MCLGNSKGLSARGDILLRGKITQRFQLQKAERLREVLHHSPAFCDQILRGFVSKEDFHEEEEEYATNLCVVKS